jgi:hypothetical protein
MFKEMIKIGKEKDRTDIPPPNLPHLPISDKWGRKQESEDRPNRLDM